MKKNIVLAFLLFFLSSCSWEEEDFATGSDNNDPQTRGYLEIEVAQDNTNTQTDEPGNNIKTIRFIVFSDLYTYPKVETIHYREIPEAEKANALNAVLGVTRTDKLIVAIANEPDNKDLKEKLDAIETPEELENLELLMADFLNNNHFLPKNNMIPMTAAIWMKKDDIQTTTTAAKSNRVAMTLLRAVARVDVFLTNEIENDLVLESGSSITLKNTYTQSPFVHNLDTLNDKLLGRILTVPSDKLVGKTWKVGSHPDEVPSAPKISKTQLVPVCSFYTPERTCRTNKLTVDFLFKTGDGEKTASIVLKEATNPKYGKQTIDTIHRNNRYIVQGNIRKASIVSDGIEVMKWNEGLERFPLSQYNLTVSKSRLAFLPGGGTENITIKTNHPNRWGLGDMTNLPAGVTVTKIDGSTIAITAGQKPVSVLETSGSFTIKAGNLSKTIYVVQVKAVLEHHGNTLPIVGKAIPQAGTTYTVEANTNLQDWRLQVYTGENRDNSTLIIDQLGMTQTISTIGVYPTQVTIPENTKYTSRKLSFYLYSPSMDITVRIGTWTQDPKRLTNEMVGLLAPPGVLGVSAITGELTLRGSKEYKGTSIEVDSEFGLVHEETVYAVFFQWGSLIAISSLPNNGVSFSIDDVAWVPNQYDYNSNKGMIAMAENLNSLTGKSAWDRVPYDLSNKAWLIDKPEQGTGNPCVYATVDDKGTLASGYRLPTGPTWNGFKGFFTATPLNLPVEKIDTYGFIDVTRIDPVSKEIKWDMFFPTSGFRKSDGSLNNGSLTTKETEVYYASEYRDSNNQCYYLYMKYIDMNNKSTNTTSEKENTVSNRMATPIRCVKR